MKSTFHCKDFDELSQKAADFIANEITSAKKQYSLALSGGSSITGVLKGLASQKIQWQAVNVFMADERWVPITYAESNYRQAHELLFSKAAGIHAFAFDSKKGVDDYNKKFRAITKGILDFVVLGVGEDGHIASLFPNNAALKNSENGYIAVHNAPKAPMERITLSHEAISNAQGVILLFASDSKKDAFEKFMDKSVKESDCPAKIALKAKSCTVLTCIGD